MTRDQPGQPGRLVGGRLGRAVQGRLASLGLTPYDVQIRTPRDGKNVYRVVAGQTPDPRLGTLLAICRTTQTDPATLLEVAGLWPAGTADGEADTLDHALLTARQRLEALPQAHKAWALGVVQALLAGAPSSRTPPAMGSHDASLSHEG